MNTLREPTQHEQTAHQPIAIDGHVVVPDSWAILGLAPSTCFPIIGLKSVLQENDALKEPDELTTRIGAMRLFAVHDVVAFLASVFPKEYEL